MTKEIYAVVYSETTHVEGDERSRTHPGHGYPAHSYDTMVFKEFKNQEEFKTWIIEETNKSYGKKSFRAFRCTPVEIKTEVKISFD